MNRWIKSLAWALILFGLTIVGARADQIISTDLYVTATTDVTLSSFGLELAITPVGVITSTPYFSMNQSDPYADTSYVFYGQSFGNDFGVPFWGPSPPQTEYPNGYLPGGDSADVPSVTLTAGDTYYLGTVVFDIPSNSDVFQLSLVSDPGQTYFDDQGGNPLTIMSYNYSSNLNGQLITISAVPEPSTSTMLAISSSIGGLLWYRRHRRASLQAN